MQRAGEFGHNLDRSNQGSRRGGDVRFDARIIAMLELAVGHEFARSAPPRGMNRGFELCQAALAETEGFEPSIRLYKRITV